MDMFINIKERKAGGRRDEVHNKQNVPQLWKLMKNKPTVDSSTYVGEMYRKNYQASIIQ